jgi:hypothetical protein
MTAAETARKGAAGTRPIWWKGEIPSNQDGGPDEFPDERATDECVGGADAEARRGGDEEGADPEEKQARREAVETGFDQARERHVGSHHGRADRRAETGADSEQRRPGHRQAEATGQPTDAAHGEGKERFQSPFGFLGPGGGELAAGEEGNGEDEEEEIES